MHLFFEMATKYSRTTLNYSPNGRFLVQETFPKSTGVPLLSTAESNSQHAGKNLVAWSKSCISFYNSIKNTRIVNLANLPGNPYLTILFYVIVF